MIILATPAHPCTTFHFVRDGEALYGRNYDFEIGEAMVLVNQRGVAKRSVAGDLQWTSRYASVTFNQYGKEFPMDGMNEQGLVVALMWLEGTVYPPPDTRPRFGVLEWIQYQLDNFGSVQEVLDHAERIRVSGGTPLHYLVGDRTGAAATIEYLDGELVVHTGASLPTPALANDRYDRSVAYLRNFSGFGGSRPTPSSSSSLDRFVRASMLMKQAGGPGSGTDRAFSILSSVAQANTRWSVVYDVASARVSWKSDESPATKTIELGALNGTCGSPLRWIDAHVHASGDVTRLLTDYSSEANLAQMMRAYATTSFLRSVPRDQIERSAAHAESFRCAPAARPRGVRR